MNPEQQSLRADIYLLLATLLRQKPSSELIEFLTQLDIEPSQSDMQRAWQQLKQAALNTNDEQLTDEYQDLFIGIGRGEVVPFASWHLTGSLMEKPLAEIRKDLQLLGLERDEQVKEPEDHIAALFEVMAALTEEDAAIQQVFFNKHIATWFVALCEQIQQAESAQFYLAVAALLRAFATVEQVQFSQNVQSTKTSLKIDVKNVTTYE